MRDPPRSVIPNTFFLHQRAMTLAKITVLSETGTQRICNNEMYIFYIGDGSRKLAMCLLSVDSFGGSSRSFCYEQVLCYMLKRSH